MTFKTFSPFLGEMEVNFPAKTLLKLISTEVPRRCHLKQISIAVLKLDLNFNIIMKISNVRSVIDVFIRYPPNSVVDMNTVTSKLIANQTGSAVNKGSRGNDGTAVVT